MPTGPSRPALPPPPSPPPRPSSVALEKVRESERLSMGKRKGYMSTLATRRGGLGLLRTEEQKALGV